MTYQELKEYTQVRQADYYEQLLVHAELILHQTRTQTQTDIGLDLGLNQSQVSVVLKMLQGYLDLEGN